MKNPQRHVFSRRYRRKFESPQCISKSKNMSDGKVCIKRFKFACMAILSPETVSIVLCQCSIMDMPVPPVPNQPKTAEN